MQYKIHETLFQLKWGPSDLAFILMQMRLQPLELL